MTAEQLEAARAERMRQNGHGAITIEDVRTWIEETGLCIFLPRSPQAGQSVQSILTAPTATPTFVEAVAGQRTSEPSLELVAAAESLLVRLEAEGVAVRLNLAGQPLSQSGDQPDYIVAGWVLPYIYALRGDRDWRRSPQLTGSRQVSQLAVLAAKQLDSANMTAAEIRDALGREVTETAVLRALHELWKQLRIIPVVAEVGVPALWQPLRQRFQKAIAEGASTSQVTAISVLASIYLQAVIAASMEDIEMFLSPLTSRSKIREVVRGLAATRQVHSTTMGQSPMFYVAGTLPEFPAVSSFEITASLPAYRSSNYRSSSYRASYLGHNKDQDQVHEPAPYPIHSRADSQLESVSAVDAEIFAVSATPAEATQITANDQAVEHIQNNARAQSRIRPAAAKAPAGKQQPAGKSTSQRPRAVRTAAHPRERSRAGLGSGEARASAGGDRRRAPMPRNTAPRPAGANGNGTRSSNTRSAASPSRPTRSFSNGNGNGSHPAKPAHSAGNGHAHNGNGSTSNGSKPAQTAWGARSTNGSSNGTSNSSNGNSSKGSTGSRLAARVSGRTGSSAGSRPESRAGSQKATPAATGASSRSAATHKPGKNSGPQSVKSGAKGGTGARSTNRSASPQRTSSEGTSRKPQASAAKRYSFSGQAKQAPKPSSKPASGRSAGSVSKTSASSAKSHSATARPVASKRRG